MTYDPDFAIAHTVYRPVLLLLIYNHNKQEQKQFLGTLWLWEEYSVGLSHWLHQCKDFFLSNVMFSLSSPPLPITFKIHSWGSPKLLEQIWGWHWVHTGGWEVIFLMQLFSWILPFTNTTISSCHIWDPFQVIVKEGLGFDNINSF